MNHGIFGYGAGRVSPYRQLEKTPETSPGRTTSGSGSEEAAQSTTSLGPNLSDAEAGMINQNFPKAEHMELRLYGPGNKSRTVHPNAIGQRLDVRG